MAARACARAVTVSLKSKERKATVDKVFRSDNSIAENI